MSQTRKGINKYTKLDGDVAITITAKGQNNLTGSFITEQEPVIAEKWGGKITRKTDVAISLTARDYKGMSQWGCNAVAIPNKPYLKIKVANKKGYDEAYEGDSVNMEYPSSTTRRGRVGGGV